MIIELLGPGGVGKSTVEPLIAQSLGIAHYSGKKRHDLSGRPQSSMEVAASRLWSVASHPLLAWAALRAHDGTPTERLRFAVDLCRRERAAARAHRLGSGVVASGPVHALCMMTGGSDRDIRNVVRHLTPADVYVRLHADPSVVTRRLADRLGQTPEDLEEHASWMREYEQASIRISTAMRRPIVDVSADGSTAEVAQEIVDRLATIQGLNPTGPDS
jgi:gluconate kinase